MSKHSQIIDDLQVKQTTPNHLATPLEKLALAGAKLPKSLSQHVAYLRQLTGLAHQLLPAVLGDELALSCQVINAKNNKLTLGFPSMTATNHASYLQVACLTALRQHESFAGFDTLKIILSVPPKTMSVPNNLSQNNSKKLLSENTKRNITQHASVVITNKNLRDALLQLASCIKPVHSEEP
ncbi:MAG: hypothetical protein Q4A69_01915 [Moraxella sp.]|nr:hypothetical protein [Moraxella sp.]